MNAAGLAEVRDWLEGHRKSNDFRRHAWWLVESCERQEEEIETAVKLLRVVLAAGVMNHGWETAATRLIGEAERDCSLDRGRV